MMSGIIREFCDTMFVYLPTSTFQNALHRSTVFTVLVCLKIDHIDQNMILHILGIMPPNSDLAPGSPQGGVGPAIHDLPPLHAAAAGHLYEEECDDSASCLELDDTPEIVRRIILQDSSQIYIPAGPWGWLPIMYAADRGDASSVQAFLDHGETTERLVHAVDGMEDTCLHIAASRYVLAPGFRIVTPSVFLFRPTLLLLSSRCQRT